MPAKKSTSKKTTTKKPVRKKPPTLADLPPADRVPLLLYRRIAVTFAVLVAAALFIVLYLSTTQAIIRVAPVQTPLSADVIIEAREIPVGELEVKGRVVSGSVGKTRTFEASGKGAVQVEDFARGTVTISNGLSFAQPLVVRTRLLSESGVLFRLTQGVTVPAGGSVQANVVADEKGAGGDIEPTHFTIPGLSAQRQAKVTAESAEVFLGGERSLSVVTQEEIDASVQALESELVYDAKEMLRSQMNETFSGETFSVDVDAREVSIESNTQADHYDVTLGVSVTGVFFDQDGVKRVAERRLYEQIGQGQIVAVVDWDGLSVTVDKVNEEDSTANLHARLTGAAITSLTSRALEPDRFLGLNSSQIKQLLFDDGVATDVEVEFFPFWVRRVPRLKDHVLIEIE